MITISKVYASGIELSVQGESLPDAIQKMTETCGSEFLNEAKCGVCGCENIAPKHRSVPDPTDKKGKSFFNYYEMKCLRPGCWAVLELGQSKDQVGLFPKRKTKEGELIGKNGWIKKEFKKKEEAAD